MNIKQKLVYMFIGCLFTLMLVACNQMENPLDTQEVANAPGADVNGETQPIVDCSEPAYLISVSPEPGSEIAPDTEITLTFNCAPADFNNHLHRNLYGDYGIYQDRIWNGDLITLNYQNYQLHYGIDVKLVNANRNIVKVSVSELLNDLAAADYEILGRTAKTFEWIFPIVWRHGKVDISYNVIFPEIEGKALPSNVLFEDILNTPHEYLDKEVTFEAGLSKWTRIKNKWDQTIGIELHLYTEMITRNFTINVNNEYWNFYEKLITPHIYRFSCVITNVVEFENGLTAIEASLLYLPSGRLLYPPVLVEE